MNYCESSCIQINPMHWYTRVTSIVVHEPDEAWILDGIAREISTHRNDNRLSDNESPLSNLPSLLPTTVFQTQPEFSRDFPLSFFLIPLSSAKSWSARFPWSVTKQFQLSSIVINDFSKFHRESKIALRYICDAKVSVKFLQFHEL